ncbi:unnamed protein product, partial [Didymodactylos carnosus]
SKIDCKLAKDKYESTNIESEEVIMYNSSSDGSSADNDDDEVHLTK